MGENDAINTWVFTKPAGALLMPSGHWARAETADHRLGLSKYHITKLADWMAVFRECDFMCIVHPPTPTAAKQSARAMVEQKAGSDGHPMQPLIIGILIQYSRYYNCRCGEESCSCTWASSRCISKDTPCMQETKNYTNDGGQNVNSPKCHLITSEVNVLIPLFVLRLTDSKKPANSGETKLQDRTEC